ncbi:MAG: phage infection protein [Pseudomonadota bacterium]
MNKLQINLENCYGIKSLKTSLDFAQHRTYAIYAPNGAMKSSLAHTFKDISDGVPSKDIIFPTRKSVRNIVDENGNEVGKGDVLTVAPYDEVLGHTEKTSTLLIDAKLRKEYEALHIEIDKAKDTFLKALAEQSHSKKDLEREISAAFTKSDSEFYRALIRIKDEIESQEPGPYADVSYDIIFDEKVLTALNTKDAKIAIKEYVEKYNELIAKSTYFKKGTFDYYNAAQIAKNLADNGFFSAKHTIRLNAAESIEITNQKQLEELISKEKEAISKDALLRKKFADLEKLLMKNAQTRDFYAYLTNNEQLLPGLANLDALKEDLWKAYIAAKKDLYLALLQKHQSAEKRRREIEEEAGKQRTDWEQVIEIFNDRFFVPFKLIAKNRVAVILGGEPILSLGFTFVDGADSASVEKNTLMQVLSTGEKKALYILNIIFEVEARTKANQPTLIVLDDIADSFYYKNKYAIIQYLIDIAERPNFRQIILTHNFDFFRTVNSRSLAKYSGCLMAEKSATGVTLRQASGIKNVFLKDWKADFFTDHKKKIACIPFIRNLIEYTRGDSDADFIKLTSLLHWKVDSAGIAVGDLDAIYNRMFGTTGKSADAAKPVSDLIAEQAGTCITADAGINFENKIVLSIAIRLCAERFMVTKLADPAFVSSITTNQSQALLTEFRRRFPTEAEISRVLQRVVLMTPENIHLNSFMYEPILDMSDDHLRKLYMDVLSLK